MTTRKKLIEVALPLAAINEACKPETENPFLKGHPRAVHVWWARTPLVACRAVIFASLVDDPESEGCPKELLAAIDRLPAPDPLPIDWDGLSVGEQRRARLFQFIGHLVKWENTTNETVIGTARELILAATGGNPPALLDPFCGRGSIPLEAQRLGLEAYASELNQVAVLITKALVEIPPKFAGRPPVNPDFRSGTLSLSKGGHQTDWKGAAGLAADVRWYGKWMRERAWERIGHLYPKGPNGETVVAWLWARTVKCPNPVCSARMPLVRSFWLSTKKGKEAWVEPIVDRQAKTVRFEVRNDKGKPPEPTKQGPNIYCLICGEPVTEGKLRKQAVHHGLDVMPLAKVLKGEGTRVYAKASHHDVPHVDPPGVPHLAADLPGNTRWFSPPLYGLGTYADLFTPRQLVALTTFSDLVGEARELVLEHARQARLPDDGVGIANGGTGATAYVDAIATYLGCAISRLVDYLNALATWNATNRNVRNLFQRQAIPMAWDFAEGNPLASDLNPQHAASWVADGLVSAQPDQAVGCVYNLDTTTALPVVDSPLIVTDPPYYDNIGYADLSDFFYVWLRRVLGGVYPDLFATVLTVKGPELAAIPSRFNGDKNAATQHFENGMHKAFSLLRAQGHDAYPVSIIYAFKQREADGDGVTAGLSSTAWETMLTGLLGAGFRVTGSWPMRTTKAARSVARDTNALASAVVLACRPRGEDAPIATRREFQQRLREELPRALRHLMGGHIAPVDLAQAAIGPGVAVFSGYSKVLEADGNPMSIRTALQLINRGIWDYFTEQEGDLDPDTQFCARWFEQHGFNSGPYGDADNMTRAANIGVDGLERDGVLEAGGGKVKLKPLAYYEETVEAYDPVTDRRPTVWEACHYLIAALDKDGEQGAARLARRLGGLADQARDLAYRLYDVCDRKGWAEPALGYNALVASWSEIQKQAATLARETQAPLRGE